MAAVDFSNATIERIGNWHGLANSYQTSLGFSSSFYALRDTSGVNAVTNSHMDVLINTPTKLKFLFSGTFTVSGDNFRMGGGYATNATWEVSNISFEAGDTYAFTIEVDLSNL